MNNVFVFKRLLPAVLALTAAALFVACDEDSDSGKSNRKTIVGHWVEDDESEISTFRADGTFESGRFNYYGTYSVFESGTYSYNGSELTRNILEGEEVGSFKAEAVVVRADSLAIKNPNNDWWDEFNRLPDAMYNQMLGLEEVPEPEKAIVGYWTDNWKPTPGKHPHWAWAIFDGRFDRVGYVPHGPYELSGRWLTVYDEGRGEWELKVAAASASTLVLLERWGDWDDEMDIWYLRRISEDEYNQILREHDRSH